MFSYEPGDEGRVLIGTWSPAHREAPGGVVTIAVHETGDGEEADRWKAELSAGRLPETRENVP